MSEERFRIFHSKVVSFERCRKQYWFRYVSDFQQPPERVTAEGLIGNAVPVDLGRVIGESIIEHVKRHVGQPSPSTNQRRGRNGREHKGSSVNA